MSRSVVIVGGGLQGLSSAFFLSERGADVTVVDRGAPGGGAARGNAGYICTTILEPLANPTAMTSALKSLKDPSRALRIKPSKAPGMATWFLRFASHGTAAKHRSTSTELVTFNRPMQALLDQMSAAGVDATQGKGLVVPFHDVHLAEHWGATMGPMAELLGRTPAPLLDGDQLRVVVPALTDHIKAGYVLETERSLDPRTFVDTLIDVLRARGVRFIENAGPTGFDHANGRVSAVLTPQGKVAGDEFVLATGAGSQAVGKMLGIKLAVIAGQGYNVALPKSEGYDSPVIFEEAHAASTPFDDQIRLGGTMEFAGNTPAFDGRRVDAIIASMRKFVNLEWDKRDRTWAGSRPMTADGKPYIGRADGWRNVTVATGHGMFGLTLAPVTGHAISELLLDGTTTADLRPFSPTRR